MRVFFLTLAIIAPSASAIAGEIKLPATIVTPQQTYVEVIYQSHSPARLQFIHRDGLASLPISSLPPDIQKMLDYDPAAAKQTMAAEQLKQRQARNAAAEQLAINARKAEARKKAEQAQPISFKVLQILSDGTIFGQIWGLENIGSRIAGERAVMVAALTDKTAFFVSAPSGIAEGDNIDATAYQDGVITKESTDGAPHTLKKFVCVTSKVLSEAHR